jgi:hypothetical protein
MRHPVWLFFFAILPATAGAQTLYKCLQGTAVTYSSTPCEKLGLKSGGEIQDRVTTLPPSSRAQRQPPPASRASPAPTGGKENEIEMPKTSAVKPVNPLIEKLAR